MLFATQQAGTIKAKGTFFTASVWEGCCFQAQQSGKGGFLESRFDTEILARVVSLTFLVWEEWEIFVWERVRVCHPGLP